MEGNLPGAYEEVVCIVEAFVLTDKKALQLCALNTHVDEYNKKRLNREEWIITLSDTVSHMPNINEIVVGIVNLTVLNSRQYAVVNDPIGRDGKPQLGKRK